MFYFWPQISPAGDNFSQLHLLNSLLPLWTKTEQIGFSVQENEFMFGRKSHD